MRHCRALVDDLRSIRAAAFMLDRHEPTPETWTQLQAAIAAEPAPKGRLLDMPGAWAPEPSQLAACGWARRRRLILATVIGLMPLMNRARRRTTIPPRPTTGEADRSAVESVTAEFEAAEKHYQKAIDDLQTIANKDTGELDPQVASVLQKNLTVIDQAITREPRGAQVAAGEQQRAERPVRRAAHQGGAAADRRSN